MNDVRATMMHGQSPVIDIGEMHFIKFKWKIRQVIGLRLYFVGSKG